MKRWPSLPLWCHHPCKANDAETRRYHPAVDTAPPRGYDVRTRRARQSADTAAAAECPRSYAEGATHFLALCIRISRPSHPEC